MPRFAGPGGPCSRRCSRNPVFRRTVQYARPEFRLMNGDAIGGKPEPPRHHADHPSETRCSVIGLSSDAPSPPKLASSTDGSSGSRRRCCRRASSSSTKSRPSSGAALPSARKKGDRDARAIQANRCRHVGQYAGRRRHVMPDRGQRAARRRAIRRPVAWTAPSATAVPPPRAGTNWTIWTRRSAFGKGSGRNRMP